MDNLTANHVLQTHSSQITAEKVNLHCPYRTSLSQIRSSFCSSLHSYRERIGLTPSPLCPSCGVELHKTVHIFLLLASLTVRDLREHRRLVLDFLFGLPFFDLLSLPPPEPPPSNSHER